MRQTIPDVSISVPPDAGYTTMLLASSRQALEVFGVAGADADRVEAALDRWFQEEAAHKGPASRTFHVNLTVTGRVVHVEVKSGRRRETLDVQTRPPDA